MKKAIVLGCHDIGLGIIRSLAAKDIEVMAIPTAVFDFAHFSRFVTTRTRRYCNVEENTKLLDFLLNLPKEWDGALIIPTHDPANLFIARYKKELSCRFSTTAQELNETRKIYNKALLYKEVQKMGVPLPKVLFPNTVEALIQEKYDITYPCILKPYEIHKFFPIFKTKVLVIKTYDELIEKFKAVQENNLDVMVSEIIPGADDNLYKYISYTGRNGEVLAELCMQKIRQHPSGFGMACVAKTVPIIQELRYLSLRLLKKFSYRGFSIVEFKFDKRDHRYKLMEINVRPVLQERLFLAAGTNFPHIAYLDHVEGIEHFSSDCKPDIYWIDLFHDAYELIKSRRIENFNWTDYLSPYFKKYKVFCTPFFDDPIPFLVRISILIRQTLKSFIIKTYKRKC